ncbi:hypothetical protein N8590_04075, partial [bacterium]|nr:hypothetical protein [bacterium]
MKYLACASVILVLGSQWLAAEEEVAKDVLSWSEISSLPDELGVAGPFAGVHKDALIVAGGANFPLLVWDT